MKPFDLEKALAGEPVVTRDGREVTQLHLFDVDENAELYQLIGVINGAIESWTKGGAITAYGSESPGDLFMKPKTVAKWVNIWLKSGCSIYDSEENADKYAGIPRLGNKAHRIEWEE